MKMSETMIAAVHWLLLKVVMCYSHRVNIKALCSLLIVPSGTDNSPLVNNLSISTNSKYSNLIDITTNKYYLFSFKKMEKLNIVEYITLVQELCNPPFVHI